MNDLVYPVCVICGNPWSIEYETMWCCNGHDTIWYYQNKDGRASFDLEVNDLHGSDYQVRWNCNCMVEECFGKNVILSMDMDDEGEILNQFDPVLPFTITREELYLLISGEDNAEARSCDT